MADKAPIVELLDFAKRYDAGLTVHRAVAAFDERLHGEMVTRISLLLDDPVTDTWDLGQVNDLRNALRRRATELGLPSVSLTLITQSEAILSTRSPGRRGRAGLSDRISQAARCR